MIALVLLACGATPPTTAPPSEPPAVAAPAASVHASGGGHMADMAATRDRLRSELGAAYDAEVPMLAAAVPAHGKPVYEQSCASCHGPAGKGDGPAAAGLVPPPADFTDAFHARYYSDAARVRIIEKGLPGTAMVGYEGSLDAQQILDVYAYVRAFREAAGAPPAKSSDGHDHAH